MSWFPNYGTRQDTELSSNALLAVGKALHICNRFESSCKWVLKMGELVAFFKKNESIAFSKALWNEGFDSLKERTLGGAAKNLGQFDEIKKTDIDVVIDAVKARNFIAHEAAFFTVDCSEWLIIAGLMRLRKEVGRLGAGANIVFSWSYEISEKEPHPKGMFQDYPKMLDDWVFFGLQEILDEYTDHPDVIKAEEELKKYYYKE